MPDTDTRFGLLVTAGRFEESVSVLAWGWVVGYSDEMDFPNN